MTTERVIEELNELKSFPMTSMSAHLLSIRVGVTERQLRKLVEQIRTNDLAKGYVLISSDSGYKLSNDSEEIGRWVNRHLAHAFSQVKTVGNAKQFIAQSKQDEIQLKLQL